MHWNFNSYLITGYGRGRIICGDIGQHSVQVLNGIKKGGNYGWNVDEWGKPMCKGGITPEEDHEDLTTSWKIEGRSESVVKMKPFSGLQDHSTS